MKFKSLSLLAFITLVCAQCSDEGKVGKVKIRVVPERPVVIESDFSYTDTNGTTIPDDDKDVDVTGPWFQFRPEFTNDSDETIVIQNIKVTITAMGIDGKPIEGTAELKLDEADIPDRSYLAELAPGETWDLNSADPLAQFTWYISSLPDRTKARSFIYRLKFEAEGWFGDLSTPTKSLRKSIVTSSTY